ncbi:MAG TPA: hypothetical protein VNM69_23210 [Bacillus sp. (in: firmicutes)]|nr:hypothetical protein [Bacillus litorisediminis]HWO78779.1 hypothetical protein [Bacillus sp. (in: firmicutes)]
MNRNERHITEVAQSLLDENRMSSIKQWKPDFIDFDNPFLNL